jgi:PiT family inorganic phosphate transporter
VGGLVGAGVAKAGMHAIVAPGVTKTVEFIILAPLIGMLLGIVLMSAALFALRDAHPGPVTRWSRLLQLASSAFYSLGHGLNDAQKTMGVITLLLISMRAKVPELEHLGPWFMPGPGGKQVPLGIVLAAQTAIALGTLSGGWRIVRTMGMRITELSPLGGVCAETAGAITLIMVSRFGIPVSTTHTITGAIVGVGASRRLSAVRWGVAGHIVWAWVLTIPCAALMAAGAYLVAGRLWPVLPGAARLLLGLLLLAGLGYGLVTWLRSSAARLAHT